MNTSNVVRAVSLDAPHTSTVSSKLRISKAWRKFTRRLFAQDVVGNPLHEAWTADGEPLERMTPEQSAKSCASRYMVVPHSQGR